MNEELLKEKALKARQNLFISLGKLGGGHYGACLSEVDILTYLYFQEMNIDPKSPLAPDRDRFVLSKGHGGFGLYAVLAERGFMPGGRLSAYENGVMLPKHADKHRIPGVDISTGSLGQGFSCACGMALASKVMSRSTDNSASPVRVYTLLGDGECNEGQVWEGAMFAAKYELDNLIAAVDYNKLQFDGLGETVMPLESLVDKWASFGFTVFRADGHNFNDIAKAYEDARQVTGKPSVIIFDTIKGKGISFMENVTEWHGGTCTEEQLARGYMDLGIDPEKRA